MVRHFKDDEVYKKNTVGKPMTPSEWVEGPNYKEVTKIRMSCGGGMGGSTWYEVVERIDFKDLVTDKFLTVKNWKGKEICINPKYIVKAEQFTLASAIINSENANYKMGLHEYNWLIEDGNTITLTDDFASY